MANPRGQQRDKPVRDALRIEAALLENGEDTPAPPGSIRHSARQLLLRAGADTAAFREIGDRLDGKPAQSIIGGDEDDPAIRLETIRRIIVNTGHSDGGSVPPVAGTGPL